MKKLLPYPLMFVALIVFWLLLNGFTPAQVLLAVVISFFACLAMKALRPQKNHIYSVSAIIPLFLTVSFDVIQSNITVVRLILSRKHERHPGFVVIPLDLENRAALAVLACIITATPGTAWVDYNAPRKTLTIHVLDLEDGVNWRDIIKKRYEQPLIRIFGAKDGAQEEKTV